MSEQTKLGEEQIRAFEDYLTELLGSGDFPQAAVGDLSDLLDTLRRGVEMLTDLMKPGRDLAPSKLLDIEILLSDDLPMIAKDLLPSLKAMRRRGYSIRSKEERQRNKSQRALISSMLDKKPAKPAARRKKSE
jgi:hypothetical protein